MENCSAKNFHVSNASFSQYMSHFDGMVDVRQILVILSALKLMLSGGENQGFCESVHL